MKWDLKSLGEVRVELAKDLVLKWGQGQTELAAVKKDPKKEDT